MKSRVVADMLLWHGILPNLVVSTPRVLLTLSVA